MLVSAVQQNVSVIHIHILSVQFSGINTLSSTILHSLGVLFRTDFLSSLLLHFSLLGLTLAILTHRQKILTLCTKAKNE